MKKDIKEEIKKNVKKSLLQEIKEIKKTTLEIKTAVNEEFEQKIETKTNEYEYKDISDGFNLEFQTLREKFSNRA